MKIRFDIGQAVLFTFKGQTRRGIVENFNSLLQGQSLHDYDLRIIRFDDTGRRELIHVCYLSEVQS